MRLPTPQPFLALLSRLKRPWVQRAEEQRLEHWMRVATERLVDQFEPELRNQPEYYERLAPVVEQIRDYSNTLIKQIPTPTRIDTEQWSNDPLVNALFAQPSALRETISSPMVHNWLQANPEEQAPELFGLLLAKPKERTQLGVELRQDRVQRDVKQTILSFIEHEIVAVDTDFDRLRRGLERPIADLIQSLCIARLATQEERIITLEGALRVLQLKLKVIQPRIDGVDLLMATSAQNLAEAQRLNIKITETERALVVARGGLGDSEQYFEQALALLAHPEEAMQLEPMSVWLDRMHVVRDSNHPSAQEIALTRAVRPEKPGRVVLFVRFPRSLILADEQRPEGEDRLPR